MKPRLLVTLMAFAVASLDLTACARVGEDRPTVKPPRKLTLDCGRGASIKLVLIPAGEFMMGGDETPEQVARKCNDELFDVKAELFQNEQPQHRVKIFKEFYLGLYEVTQAQYESVMGVNPSPLKEKSHPVVMISWYDAGEFCKRLSAKTGRTVRLPTEAEWEYACRAGTTTPFNTGETISTDQANYIGDFTGGSRRHDKWRQKTVAVGSFEANAFGLYDMHGNVSEWCQDWYEPGYYKTSLTDDPRGPEEGKLRVLRGGCWNDHRRALRSAVRFGIVPTMKFTGFGFRVVCEPKP